MPIVAPLVELGVLALVLWAVASALAVALLMRYIGDVFRRIPVVGGYIAGAADSVAQAISYAAGKLEHGVDRLIGASWHLLARYMDHLWHHLEGQAGFLVHMAETALGLTHAHVHLKSIVHKAVGAVGHVVPRVKRLEKEWHGIEHRVRELARELHKGIGHDLRIHVKALERALGRVEHRVIPNIRSIAQGAEHEVTSLRKWVKDHALIAGTAAFAGSVAWALSRLGLGWLRCSTNPFNNNKRACALWGDLAGLLGLVTTVLIAEDFEQLVREMQTLEGEAIGVAKDLFDLG